MLHRILSFAVLFAFVAHTAGLEQCSSDASLDVKERKVDHGALSSFYAIAQGIADGLQPIISNETLAEIKNLLKSENYNQNELTKILERQFKNEQSGTVVFFMVGFVIAVLSLIFGVVVLIWQCCACVFKGCCCGGKDRDSWDNKSISICGRILLLVALVCSAAFILTGLIINNQSSSRVFSAVEDSNNFVRGFTGDVRKLYNNSTKSVICAVDKTVNKTLDQVDQNMRTAPTLLLNRFKNLTGIALLGQIDWQKIQATVNDTSETSKSMRKSIQDVQASSPSIQCETKLIAAKAALDKVDSENEIVQNITEVGTIEEDTEAQIYNTTNNLAQPYVSDAIDQVRKKWNEFRGTIENSDQVSKALDDLDERADDVIDKATKSQYYEPVKQGFALLVVIPAAITLVVILFTVVLLLLYGRDRRGNLSCMANCGFKTTMIGFYITIIFAFLVLLLSSVEYLAGTMTSAGCKTLFQDPSYSGLSIFSLKNAELLEGHTINISAGDVLVQCRENRTLWTAIGADKVFDPSSVLKDLHLPSIDDETSKLVDQVKEELAEFKQQIESPKNQAGKAAQDLKTLGDSLDPYLSFSECSAFNPTATKNIENGVASLKSSVAYFRDQMEQINDILTIIITKDAKLQEIQEDVRDLAEQPVREGIEDILNDLTTKLLPCRGVYNTYHNLGSYLCGDLGGPIHGLWASAGLCGLFFVVTSIIVLIVNCMR